MACTNPLTGYRSKWINPSGKRAIVFNSKLALDDSILQIPCGRCMGCRLEKSRQWAVRIMHEASLHEQNVFATLTYSPENLPLNKSINVETFQNFMKRLRIECGPCRFFHCGEYGEKNERPHYHAILFGMDFDDKLMHKKSESGEWLFKSEKLEKIWKLGHCLLGSVTFESAAYVARYVTKKITGEPAKLHYMNYDKETGEILGYRRPEYVTMSRNPGIGSKWIEQHMENTYGDGEGSVLMRNKLMRPPKYYDEQVKKMDEERFEGIKNVRDAKATERGKEWSSRRLRAKARVIEARHRFAGRKFENG